MWMPASLAKDDYAWRYYGRWLTTRSESELHGEHWNWWLELMGIITLLTYSTWELARS